jgi:N-acetylmuramoyl-L-alanine amidase
MKMKKRNILWMLFIALTLFCIPYTKVSAASKLNFYDYGTKKTINYTDKQVKYYLDGKEIKTVAPGIIIDGISLVSFRDVFVNSNIGAKFDYSPSNGVVTLKLNGTTIKYTVGSKTAYVNGKKTTLSIAPKKLKMQSGSYSQVFVPARFTAETLGYKYAYNSSNGTVSMTSPMNLYYNGKQVAYTGTIGSVSVDGKVINLGKMPSIIINDTAMVYAYKVFGSAPVSAKYNYNEKEGTVTLSKNDVTVKLTLGSKTAYVNGKAHTMDTAPLLVKNLDSGAAHVMVPGSFISSYLGYNYRWDSSLKRSVITSRTDEDNNTGNPDGPELGGDDFIPEDKVFLEWNLLDEYQDDYKQIGNTANAKEIKSDETNTANIYSVTKDSQSTGITETYSITSTTPFGNVTSTLNDQALTLHVSNASTNNTNYNLEGTYVGNASTTYNYANISTDVILNLNQQNMDYTLSLSEDKCTLKVTFFKNYLSKVTAGIKEGNDYITLTGLSKLDVQLTESSYQLTLQLSNINNGIGTKSFVNETAESLHSLRSVQSFTVDSNSSIQIIIEKSEDATYEVTQTDNEYTISFKEERPETVPSNVSVIQFKMPEYVDFSEITHEDRYYNNKFSIYVPGDQRSFYANAFYGYQDGRIKNISLNYDSKNDVTEIIVNTTKLQGYKLKENNGYIDVTVGDPKDIYKNIVVLDAGHGGTDPGALRKLNGKTINEKDVNFSIIYDYCKKIFDAPESEIKAYYSRYNDTKVDLYERAAFAKKVGADMFISLHMNANTKTTVRGTEIYYSDANNAMSPMGLNSKKFASIFLDNLPSAVGTQKRSIFAKQYVVTKYNTVPAILIELGFMSNTSDLTLMTKSSFRESTAEAIYDILQMVFTTYPTGR